jgi:hypothetical protein
LEVPATRGEEFDIGGSDILTYREMLKTFAELLHKERFFVRVPFSNISLSSYVASLMTPVPAPLIRCLMEGLQDEVVCQESRIRDLLPFEPLTYREAITRAISREEQDRVDTRWSDAYPRDHDLAVKLHQLGETPLYRAHHSLVTGKDASRLFASTCKIGGREGWFHSNWMWRLRGAVDRMLLGVGTARARKSYSTLAVGDVIDFWRIEDLRPDERLLLRAEMKIPGSAWLEFKIENLGEANRLSVIAHYHTTSLWGRLYWYSFMPFHRFIFQRLIEQIEEKS